MAKHEGPAAMILKGPDGRLYSVPSQKLNKYRLKKKTETKIIDILAGDRVVPPRDVKLLSDEAAKKVHAAVKADDGGVSQCCDVVSA
jgi:hypothetical protein